MVDVVAEELLHAARQRERVSDAAHHLLGLFALDDLAHPAARCADELDPGIGSKWSKHLVRHQAHFVPGFYESMAKRQKRLDVSTGAECDC
jgi:hypothetical protein